LQLPGNSIGITDILTYRDCPRKFSFGMKRHTGPAQQNDRMAPESATHGAVWARRYGSAIHDAIQALEEGHDEDAAIQIAWNRSGSGLDPSDIDLLREDLAVYRQRDSLNVRTVAAEDEFRVPLFRHDGEVIFFRFKIDRLYERLDRPGHFVHIDYKSSKHRKTANEVHQDPQMWSYNFGIHDFFPECVELEQIYDQLRFGQERTRKSDAQRRQMREWLIRNIRAILADETVKDDGLLEPQFNEWCPWCPVLESCPVVDQLTDWSATRIGELAPVEPVLKRDGSPGKRMKPVPLEPTRLPEYLEQMERSKRGRQVLERFEEGVRALVTDLPLERRVELGYEVKERRASVFTNDAKERLHQALGPRFYDLVKITKSGLESALEGDDELLQWALDLAVDQVGASVVSPVRAA
jgi:hypothetical protein